MRGDRILDFMYEAPKPVGRQSDAILSQTISHTGALLVIELKLNHLIDRHSLARLNPRSALINTLMPDTSSCPILFDGGIEYGGAVDPSRSRQRHRAGKQSEAKRAGHANSRAQ
jgi:hypothetical protein